MHGAVQKPPERFYRMDKILGAGLPMSRYAYDLSYYRLYPVRNILELKVLSNIINNKYSYIKTNLKSIDYAVFWAFIPGDSSAAIEMGLDMIPTIGIDVGHRKEFESFDDVLKFLKENNLEI